MKIHVVKKGSARLADGPCPFFIDTPADPKKT